MLFLPVTLAFGEPCPNRFVYICWFCSTVLIHDEKDENGRSWRQILGFIVYHSWMEVHLQAHLFAPGWPLLQYLIHLGAGHGQWKNVSNGRDLLFWRAGSVTAQKVCLGENGTWTWPGTFLWCQAAQSRLIPAPSGCMDLAFFLERVGFWRRKVCHRDHACHSLKTCCKLTGWFLAAPL